MELVKDNTNKETVTKGDVTETKVDLFTDGKALSAKVSRKELIEILQQLTENMNQSNQYHMDDINQLYSRYVIPNIINLQVLTDILVEKGITTKEDIDKRYNEKVRDMVQKAKVVRETNKGLEEVSKEESKTIENEKILHVLKDNTKKKTK
jgi:ribose 1,5-bisphosphokinase PhnN